MNLPINHHMVHEDLRPQKGQKKGHLYQEVDTTLMEILYEMVMAVSEQFVSLTSQIINTRTTTIQMQLTQIENENLPKSLQRLPRRHLVLLRIILAEINSLEIMESRMKTFIKM